MLGGGDRHAETVFHAACVAVVLGPDLDTRRHPAEVVLFLRAKKRAIRHHGVNVTDAVSPAIDFKNSLCIPWDKFSPERIKPAELENYIRHDFPHHGLPGYKRPRNLGQCADASPVSEIETVLDIAYGTTTSSMRSHDHRGLRQTDGEGREHDASDDGNMNAAVPWVEELHFAGSAGC